MKIGVAQIRPIKGDIQTNIRNHNKFIDIAVSNGADTLIFPELSLTGYEPRLAKALATTADDKRFDGLQKKCDASGITVGVGTPVLNNDAICIGVVLFQPHQPRRVYLKKYLHSDEEEFFAPGESFLGLIRNNKAALAICYELSVPEHSADAFKKGAEIYIATAAKSPEGVEKASESLSRIASTYNMTVLLSNSVGPCEGFISAGKSSIWNPSGILMAQLTDRNEGILMIDPVDPRPILVEW